jgi:hypothetical protein
VYLIYLYSLSMGLSDIFTITAEEVTRPANDLCEDAIALELNVVVTGTTNFSSADRSDPCVDASLFGYKKTGVWYTFEGNGGAMVVGLRSGAFGGTGLVDAVLSVHEGSCDALTCVGFQDLGDGYQDFENFVVIDSVSAATYHVFVHGFGIGDSDGNFEIAVLGVERPANDACADATALELGDSVEGSTRLAHMSDNIITLEDCGTSRLGNVSATGVWYTVVGGGFPVQASVIADYDMQLTVFSGGCEALVCVNGTNGRENDPYSGAVIWDAEESVPYTIFVHGFDETGGFELFYETAIF